MSAVTFSSPFVRTEEGNLVPGEAKPFRRRSAPSPRRAVLLFKGAVAFSRSGDPNVGEFEDAKVLLAVGEVLTMNDLVNAAASM